MNKQRFFYCEWCDKKCLRKIGLGVHQAKCKKKHVAQGFSCINYIENHPYIIVLIVGIGVACIIIEAIF